ncbi:MAG: citrate lyase subunit alpha [Firmicutes bacterium]|nr:citrate lyase subunit alpha [Bacillota bacterium]
MDSNKSNKIVSSIEDALRKVGLKDGMTISFHHHLRNGDAVLNMVMESIETLGIKDIHLAASGIFPCHEPLVKLMENQAVTTITTSTFNPGPVPTAISKGILKNPVRLMSHGGRARAIEQNELHIDIAFIAAPCCDPAGNMNGTEGPSACGYLSYAYTDAQYADKVVAITDHIVDYPACPIEIRETNVDYVVVVDSIGNPNGIVSGSTKITSDPVRLKIADETAALIDELGFIKNGLSFQTGASSTSLAVAERVKQRMQDKKVVGTFALGGIHSYLVRMLEDGQFKKLLDTQSFDLESVASAKRNKLHMALSASQYANPSSKSCAVNNLDVVILGATEIDEDFNVNVITGSNGIIMGAAGGHSDCAAGAKLSIVVSNLMKKDYCVVKKHVCTIATPGQSIDAVVTEFGIAINPLRKDLLACLQNSKLNIVPISYLRNLGEKMGAKEIVPETSDRIVGVVEYRDGTIIDNIYQIVDK